MKTRNLRAAACVAGALATALFISGPAAFGGTQDEGQSRYKPIQSLNHDFGSKFVSGYFVQDSSHCLVTLMIVERPDPDAPASQTPTRVRLVLEPGQVAGLDSEEGYSVNVTCGDEAESLIVDSGRREKLVSRQHQALRQSLAEAPQTQSR